MKMSSKLQATAKSLRAVRLRMPKRASADAYAQLDRFLTVSEATRNFGSVLDTVETLQAEVVIKRKNKPIARLVPEPQAQNALEVLGDIYRTLDDDTADALAEAINSSKKTQRAHPRS